MIRADQEGGTNVKERLEVVQNNGGGCNKCKYYHDNRWPVVYGSMREGNRRELLRLDAGWPDEPSNGSC
jgi:hypothetical protein